MIIIYAGTNEFYVHGCHTCIIIHYMILQYLKALCLYRGLHGGFPGNLPYISLHVHMPRHGVYKVSNPKLRGAVSSIVPQLLKE